MTIRFAHRGILVVAGSPPDPVAPEVAARPDVRGERPSRGAAPCYPARSAAGHGRRRPPATRGPGSWNRKSEERMAYWLVKSDPDTYGIADLERDRSTRWDGVSNPVAVRHL